MIRWLAFLTLALSCAHARTSATSQPLGGEVSIADFGAAPDGPDNRAAIQAALNAGVGVTVLIPPGRWTVGRAGAAYYSLTIPAGTTLRGFGPESVLVMAAGTAPSVRLLEVAGAGVTIEDLELDGQRALQTADEHRHGVFARAGALTIRHVRATAFTGDGFYLYNGADGSTLDAVIADGNGRNGVTYGGLITGGLVTGSTFRGNAAQQIDSEPGGTAHVDGIRITGSMLDATDGAGGLVSNDYALTICGSAAAPSSNWTVEDNTIVGGFYVVWSQDVVIRRNRATNPTSKPSVTVWRAAQRVTIGCAADAARGCGDGNDLASSAAAYGVAITGTGTGQAPADVVVRGNRITASGSGGVFASGALSVLIADNVIANPRGTGALAIGVRATDPATPFTVAQVLRNQASGWARGINAGGVIGSAAALTQLTARDNQLGAPMWLDDGSGALRAAVLSNNAPAEVARWPAGAELATSCEMTMTRAP